MKRAQKVETEFIASIEFYDRRSLGLGSRFQRVVERATTEIANDPARFASDGELRQCVLQKFPFAIYFLEHEDSIGIIAVAHTSREPGYWSQRGLNQD
ncbi:MAG: type II toxin-antitoxin system RelE/ParE family toxin [Fimbriimonadaceae bacterium]